MNNKKTLILLLAAFVVLLGGAWLLYERLGSDMELNQLAVQEEQQEQTAEDAAGQESAAQKTPSEQEPAQEEPEKEPVLAPDFTVYTEEGEAAKLSDFVGKPIVLNFWASWCGPCKSEMPDFELAYRTYGEEIQFLMVNSTTGRETKESAVAFIEQQGYTFPVFYDTDVDASMIYGVYSLPTTYFIDAQGYVIAMGRGALTADNLETGIGMIRD